MIKKNRKMIIGFLAPTVILYCLVFLYPVINTVLMSFFKLESPEQALAPSLFTGLGNYVGLLTNKLFLRSMQNIMTIWLVGGIGVLIISLIYAVILTSGIRFKRSLRSIIYLPNVISAVAMGTMWLNYVYAIDYGLLNKIITFFGGQPVAWTEPGMLFWSMLIAYSFGMVGYHMLIFISGIERIGIDFYEAATIEGANVFQKFFFITLPLLKGVIRSNIVIWTVSTAAFFVWGQIFSPVNLSNDTVTPVGYMYELVFGSSSASNSFRDSGTGAAIGVCMALFVVIVTLASNLIVRKDDIEL